MYEKANVKGVGYKNVETIVQTQTGLAGNKLVEKESGSGNVITEKTEIEAGRDPFGPKCNGGDCDDYINFTKEAEFEYMPVSYQTGTYDQKWIEKLCVQNYYIGAVVVEMYTHAEHLQKNTEVKSRRDCRTGAVFVPGTPGTDPTDPIYIPGELIVGAGRYWVPRGYFDTEDPSNYIPVGTPNPPAETHRVIWLQNDYTTPGTTIPGEPGQPPVPDRWEDASCGRCTGALEANFNSNVIGVAHIGWLSRNVQTNSKGRHDEWGRSVEDLTGVFSIEKFIQLWGNGTCGEVEVGWLPCI
ncbi:MAG: hypothetical protein PHH78_06550 [Methanothrix sp.]|nr:hypothetical protein [Methanothrix sp.]